MQYQKNFNMKEPFHISIITKFSTINFLLSVNQEKRLNKLAAATAHMMLISKNLYTDGTQPPFYSKVKVQIEGKEKSTCFDVMPSSNDLKVFTQIAWGCRNLFISDFTKIFKVSPNEMFKFKSYRGCSFIKDWLKQKELTRKETLNPNVKLITTPKDDTKGIKQWITFISTPMYG
jgi:hypothetical protein